MKGFAMTSRATLALAGLLLLSNVALAQRGGGAGGGRAGPGGRRGMPGMQGNQPNQPDRPAADPNGPRPMMQPPGSPAEVLLRQRERLQLTDDQVKRLESLAKTQRDALKPNRATMLRAAADLADARDRGSIDSQRAAMQKLANIRIDQALAREKAFKDAREVLTADQRDRIPAQMMAGRRRGARGANRPGRMGGVYGGGAGRGAGRGAGAVRPPRPPGFN